MAEKRGRPPKTAEAQDTKQKLIDTTVELIKKYGADSITVRNVCEEAGLNVLKVTPGHVLLPGYSEGFIGGTAGRVGDEILFNGDLSAHPDFGAIRDFIRERGLGLKYFDDCQLTDIGSVIEV